MAGARRTSYGVSPSERREQPFLLKGGGMDTDNKLPDEYCWRGALLKDNKLVCDVQSYTVSITLPTNLVISAFDSASSYPLSTLPRFQVYPLGGNPARQLEWQKFLTYLSTRNKVAIVLIVGWQLFFNPPRNDVIHPKQPVNVSYRKRVSLQPTLCVPLQPRDSQENWADVAEETKECVHTGPPKFARTHPSYLETLGQSHASWIFGAIAELVDNARDARATRIDVTIESEYFKAANARIPILCVTDNGSGMTHADLIRMVSFGHKRPEADNESVIGRFGVGFKTGAMRLGKDAVVFTQSQETRSIAFLSRSFNEGKEEVEIPIITYNMSKGMELDEEVHNLQDAEIGLKAVKDYSPFNEYSIGHRFSVFGEGMGTSVCIYNLDKWGSDYTLEWDCKATAQPGGKAKHDITIRSRRVRTRPAQMSKEVPLDYSLHAYLEVMFLDPKMKIYVQGTLVKTRRLHKSLNKTRKFKAMLLGKKVDLTLGRSKEERDRGNCGIFLYWHGRLIEAYKRVGGMFHTADMGRGVVGVIDVTEIMRLENGSIAVLNNKQGFQDCEAYAVLEEWLGNMANTYWDENFDCLEVEDNDENAEYTPDHSWVQCNKCLKWRILDRNFDSKDLPAEWFCFMPPFKGTCTMAQEEVEAGVVTMCATRSNGSNFKLTKIQEEADHSTTEGNSIVSDKEFSDGSVEDMKITPKEQKSSFRRLKRGPASKGRQAATGKKAQKSC